MICAPFNFICFSPFYWETFPFGQKLRYLRRIADSVSKNTIGIDPKRYAGRCGTLSMKEVQARRRLYSETFCGVL